MIYTLLSHHLTTRTNVDKVLQIYSRIRLPMASRVAELSRQNGAYFSLQQDGDTEISLPELGRRIQEGFEWCSETDPFVDVRRGLELLEASANVGQE